MWQNTTDAGGEWWAEIPSETGEFLRTYTVQAEM